ncbi:PEP/pyruvate-binding domain-containing protein [Hoeflea prorocentri]|uniref:PEP-utilizing enzyme n=1 Tax=Hoeflea prorocentri TaxID=1922333 RepID=A0A9X3ULV4_9HYPH|nr:PEP/pyruvate-binding domain-containing protein [Hoeflea prorocentri]MCY6383002.1 PEP-utilizing enzyme [Hoeflea prorocentri]MDA5400802.1 PEP-utilizing enzyme [Hoeflea prorocentri]
MNARSDIMVLSSSSASQQEAAGGKARALARLASAGFNPPAFFVVLPGAFNKTGLKPDHKKGVAASLSQLGEGPFAVRSSGAQEDGADHSHAGQFLSLLNVSADMVTDAAHKVWLSGSQGSVTAYRETHGLDEQDPAPAVVVQKMIKADAAGVAFSADPVSGLRHHVVISAIAGLGDRLVSGEEDGETWVFDAIQEAITTEPDGEPVLTRTQAGDVARLAKQVEAAFGAPQDIEWALSDGVLHILQARPITTGLHAEAMLDDQVTIFDNSNIVESYPGLVTPLTYSFACYAYARVYRAFVRMVGVRENIIGANAPVFDNLLGRVDGRVYYNLVNWYRALALLPGFAVNRAHMETMMGVSEPLPASVTATLGPGPLTGLARWREYLRMGRAGAGLVIQAFRLPGMIRDFQSRLNASLGPASLDVNAAASSELAAEYRRIEASLLDRWDAPIVNDFLCMIAFGASRKLMERWFGPAGLELHNHVMIGQGDIISAEPAKRIARMGQLVASAAGLADEIDAKGVEALAGHGALREEFDAYIDRFGDRCTEELKLESVTLDEDPSALLAAVAASSRRSESTGPASPPPASGFAEIAKGKPVRRAIARILVGWAKARVRDRENLRFERTRIFGRARKVFLAMGREFQALGHLENPRDIFFLTVEEVLGAIEGHASTQNLRPLVDLRRAELEASAARQDPPERLTVRGPVINVLTRTDSGADTAGDDSERQRTGTACSAGTVTARARVISDPATQSLDRGDILVARHTDPGWIAVFSNASAIVVERGSLLSHSAIVAREMGIPCVVALKGATAWIRDGETITVDGASGDVTRVEA